MMQETEERKREEKVQHYHIVLCLAIVSIAIEAITLTNIISSPLYDQFKGPLEPIPNWVFYLFISCFFILCIWYITIHWFYKVSDTKEKDENITRTNIKWILGTFFFSSVLYFLFGSCSDADNVLVFSTILSIQFICCIPIVVMIIMTQLDE